MTKTDQTPTSSPRRTSVGRHRSRTFFDSLLHVHQRACRKGEHRFGKALPIGGGIQRRDLLGVRQYLHRSTRYS